MNTPLDTHMPAKKTATWLENICRQQILTRIKNITWGGLTVTDISSAQQFKAGPFLAGQPTAELTVVDPQFYVKLALWRDIGAGEAYASGMWTASDLTTVLHIILQNSDVFDEMQAWLGWVSKPIDYVQLKQKANHKAQAKKNIAAHYDLGNDFFAQWLDPRMMYSSAVFLSPKQSLADAQTEKIDRICRKLRLQPGQTVAEIGSGWGGFAIYAAQHYGVHVTSITISKEQHSYAVQAVKAAGLEQQVNIVLQDYRDMTGQFDALVSIEMIEAVGEQFFDTYFAQVGKLLKPTGVALIQAITIRDHRYEQYRKQSDFIRKYIFPGGCLPSLALMQDAISRHTDLKIHHLEDLGDHYAQTLQCWRAAFFKHQTLLPKVNQDPWFIKLWEFYLCSCSALFTTQQVGLIQVMYSKPMARPAPVLMEPLCAS